MNTLIAWGVKCAPYFIALPMAIFGVQHFIYLQFVADFIPAWIPWRTFWACFTGVALIAAAAGIMFKFWDRWAATLLGTMIFLWVLLLHTSRIAAQPVDFGEWRGIFQAMAMSGCAFALAGSLAQNESSPVKPTTGFGQTLSLLSEWGVKAAPWFIGVAMTALGLEHFIFAHTTVPQVPLWVPGPAVGNYLSGAALIACGLGVCLTQTRRNSARLLGILIFLSMLIFHIPAVLRSSRFDSDWTKTLVMSGGAFLLAGARRGGPRLAGTYPGEQILRSLAALPARADFCTAPQNQFTAPNSGPVGGILRRLAATDLQTNPDRSDGRRLPASR